LRKTISRQHALHDIATAKAKLGCGSEDDLRSEGFEGESYFDLVLDFISHEYAAASNMLLAEIFEFSTCQSVIVAGTPVFLAKCKCCGLRTITEPGSYEICRWCNWEDDGTLDAQVVSSVNRSSIEMVRQELRRTGRLSKFHRWE